jgi:hypothetical protein
MPEKPSFAQVQDRIRAAIEALAYVHGQAHSLTDAESTEALYQGLSAALSAAAASLGECRLAEPFSPLHPVLDDAGLRWCCNHDPEHCAR